jgi:hypothetical protein
MTTPRRVTPFLLLASAVLVGTTACTGTGTPVGAPAPTGAVSSGSPTATASAGPASASPASPVPTGGSTSAAGSAECKLESLSVTAGKPGAAGGHSRVVLAFINTGTAPCTMQGYPGVAILDAGSAQVAQARRTPQGYSGGLPAGQSPPLVPLQPGQSASAIIEALDFNEDGTACKPWSGLLVTAPDDTRSTQLVWAAGGCADPQVHPVVPGLEGSLG